MAKHAPALAEEFRQQRIGWLRKQKRMPLHQRFNAVLGHAGPALQKQLKAALRKDGSTGQSFERQARAILRACSNIALENGGEKRRRQYVQKCIASFASSHTAIQNEPERSGQNLLEQVATKSGNKIDTVWKIASVLFGCYRQQWPADEDRCIAALHGILENAQHAKYPLRYLRAVVKNETAKPSANFKG